MSKTNLHLTRVDFRKRPLNHSFARAQCAQSRSRGGSYCLAHQEGKPFLARLFPCLANRVKGSEPKSY